MNLDFGPTSNTKGNTFRIYPQIVNRNLALAVWRYSRICGLMLKLPHFRKDYLVPETKLPDLYQPVRLLPTEAHVV